MKVNSGRRHSQSKKAGKLFLHKKKSQTRTQPNRANRANKENREKQRKQSKQGVYD